MKPFAHTIAPTVTDFLNSSFLECEVPIHRKKAHLAPLLKAQDIEDCNTHLRPISLTSTLQSFVIQNELKPKFLNTIYAKQFAFSPGSSKKVALISMHHKWLVVTDGTSSKVRIILLDYKKAFDLVDHDVI